MRTNVIKWIGYTAFGLLLSLLSIITILSFTYDKTLIKYLKKYLNEHLLTEIIVDEIDFSLIKRFPSATVEFSNVVVKSRAGLNCSDFKTISGDTLMSAKKVYFQFNLISLLRKKYQLKRIHFVNGQMNLLTDKSGRNNYSIWRSFKNEKSQEYYKIDFLNFIISDFNFYYNSLQNTVMLNSFIKKAVFTGSLSNRNSNYSLKTNLYLRETGYKGTTYFKEIPVFLDIKASETDNSLLISPSIIALNKLQFQIQGDILLKPSLNIDVSIASQNFGLNEIISITPEQGKKYIGDYAFGGRGKISAQIKGGFSKVNFPLIQTNYRIMNGSVTNRITKSKLSQINIKGSFVGNNLTNLRLALEDFNARLSTGKIQGSITIKNFQNPFFFAEINSTIDLNNLYHFIEYESIESMSGIINTSLKAEGIFSKSENISLLSILSQIKTAFIECDDCSFKFKGSDYQFQDINGKIHVDQIISFQDLAVTLNQSNFIVTGTIENLFNYLADKKSIVNSNLYFYSKMIDFNSLMDNKSDSSDSLSIILPHHFALQAKINADEFLVGKFNANEMKCNVSYIQNEISIKNFNIKFIDGTISGNSLITQQEDSCFLITCNADLNRIDIQQLFTSLNNFSQDFIVDENLRGKLGGNITFSACWDSHLNFIPPSLTAHASIEIINGELLKFDPMMSLSKYINVDELKHIKFKTLTNKIYIYKQNITIPEMLIHSSAFNISLSGTHSFENQFDYRLKIALTDILFRKAKRKQKEIDDYLLMENEPEKTTIPISIIGTPDDYKVQFDSKKAFDLIKENLQKEGKEIKDAFGRDKSSSSEKANKSEDNTIEWEDKETRQPRIKESKTNKSDDELRIKWDEGDSSDVDFFN
jgi:hypothetical protein